MMACYVCLIILLSDLDSSENMFESAVFRTVETVMGVVVYTLISVFLWPRTNLGAIRKSSAELAASLNDICRVGRDRMLGRQAPESELSGAASQSGPATGPVRTGAPGRRLGELRGQRGDRHLWERFHGLSTAFLETVGRWQSGFAELDPH